MTGGWYLDIKISTVNMLAPMCVSVLGVFFFVCVCGAHVCVCLWKVILKSQALQVCVKGLSLAPLYAHLFSYAACRLFQELCWLAHNVHKIICVFIWLHGLTWIQSLRENLEEYEQCRYYVVISQEFWSTFNKPNFYFIFVKYPCMKYDY